MIETTLTLADGRSLGMAEWGPPDAPVVVYCHGFPGSRLEPSLAQAVVEQRSVNARVIAFDRPGYGRSTFVRNRTLIDWPADMAEAADRLGVGEFSVLGASGGCPYALACASVLGARVTRVGIVAGVGPLDATGMPESQLISGPSNLRILRKLQWRLVARAARTDRVDTAYWLVLPGIIFGIAAISLGIVGRKRRASEVSTVAIALGVVALLLVPSVLMIVDNAEEWGRDCALNPTNPDC